MRLSQVFMGMNPTATATEVYAAMRDKAAVDKITTDNDSNPLWTSSPNLLMQIQNFTRACNRTEVPSTPWCVLLSR
jgi:hypothetical protein